MPKSRSEIENLSTDSNTVPRKRSKAKTSASRNGTSPTAEGQ